LPRCLLSIPAAALAVILGLLPPGAPALATQVLVNGGFEDGQAGWSVVSAAPPACTPRTGGGVLGLAPSNFPASASQRIPASAGQGPYQLNGYARSATATNATLQVRLLWMDAEGATILESHSSPAFGASYQSLALTSVTGPAGATELRVQFQVLTGASICIDDVTLEGPPPVSPTPSPTVTLTPLPTDTPTRTPSQEHPTSTPRPPTSTRIPSATRTPTAPATARPRAAATSSVTGTLVSESIANGGFEDGLAPWLKVGGELSLVSSPVRSGHAAGALTSTTTSTKWAYQVVSVSPGETYEFAGFLRPGAGVSEAYLRISWYTSADGSGSALGNTDSDVRLSGPQADFVYLTTGPVSAPSSANSARVRAMMAPAGAATAVLYLDDMAFGPSAGTPGAEDIAPASPADDAIGSAAGDFASAPQSAVPSDSPGPQTFATAEQRVLGRARTPGPAVPIATTAGDAGDNPGGGSRVVAYASIAGAFVLGAAGTVAAVRFRRKE
jgi:hypothetical protein